MDATDLVGLAGFVAVTFVAASSGAVFKPGAWYFSLSKPSWTPPPWAFPVVWSILYLMIALSGWVVWRKDGLAGAPLAFTAYGVQLVLNAAWSAIFFGLRRPDLALIEVAFLWASIAVTILLFWPLSETAAWLMVPYLIWVSIAAALNFAIVRLNPSQNSIRV